MGLREHAVQELRLIGMNPDDPVDGPNQWMAQHILKMVDVFAAEGHSGASAVHAIQILERLLQFEPLSPLTGADSEWNKVTDDLWQNKRCSHVFKTTEGAYDLYGRAFVEPNGTSFTSNESKVPVTFPYTPHTEYVHRETKQEHDDA